MCASKYNLAGALKEVSKEKWLQGVTKHGAFVFQKAGYLKCDQCFRREYCKNYSPKSRCKVLQKQRRKLINAFMSYPHVFPQDYPLVESLVKELLLQSVIEQYLEEVGMFKYSKKTNTLDVQPVVQKLENSRRRSLVLFDRLGMSPMARAKFGKLKAEPWDLAKAMMAVREEDEDSDEGETETIS